jgi:hypothetical protein
LTAIASGLVSLSWDSEGMGLRPAYGSGEWIIIAKAGLVNVAGPDASKCNALDRDPCHHVE